MSAIPDIIDRLLAAVKADAPIQRALVVSAAVEIERLRFVVSRIAEQDATLSVVGGNVIVQMDATLTDAEREAVKEAADAYEQNNGDPDCERIADTLHGLLDRLGGT